MVCLVDVCGIRIGGMLVFTDFDLLGNALFAPCVAEERG